jgi:hypothetical protein
MKRISIILIIICALFVGSVATHAQNIIGEWNATKALVADEAGNKATVSLASLQASMQVVFLENNQIKLSFDGDTEQGTYLLDKGILYIEMDGEIVPFPVRFTDDNTFEMDWSQLMEENIIFVLEKATASATSEPTAEYTGPINLLGSWAATEIRMDVDGVEMNYNLSMLGYQLSMSIIFLENNQMVLTLNDEIVRALYQLNGNQLILVFSESEYIEKCPIKFITADKFEVNLEPTISDETYIFVRQ